MTHDSFTTSRGEYCIVDGCSIVDGRHVLEPLEHDRAEVAAGMAAARADAEARTVTRGADRPVHCGDAQCGALLPDLSAPCPACGLGVETAGASAPTPATEAPAPPKRKRRTKAEVEADKAAAAKPKPEISDNVFEGADFTPAVIPDTAELTPIDEAEAGAAHILSVIRAEMQETPREPMGNVGPSMLGGCERKIGYRLAFGETGERDDGSWIARVGTAGHADLARMFKGRVEADGSRRWYPDLRITKPVRGQIDLYDAARREVTDFKFVGATTLGKARRGEIDVKYDVQLDVYGVGLIAAGYHVERVAVLFLPKTQGLDKAVWYSRPLDVGRAVAAVERLRRVEGVISEVIDNDRATEAGWRDALAELEPSEDFCRECPAMKARMCSGPPPKIERMPEWPAYDLVLAALEAAA